ncbi:MAG: Rhomboid protease GlpG [Candidatus Anoxychlamydiales bacterium]|nr:Rhomboid protease GlpG [Candidatus Anoxychlamydiales bacterium]HEU64035.1 rhomboid family intramembrane serine protease [Chlamydiota bacterium]
MRIVASFDDESLASRFSIFLKKEDIENDIEQVTDKDTQKLKYSIWVKNEDFLDVALRHFQNFMENPKDSKYDVKIEKPIKNEEEKNIDPRQKDPIAMKKSRPYFLTFFFLFLCIILYFVNFMQEMKVMKKYNLKQQIMLTPIQMSFLYDLPEQRLLLDDVIIKYQLSDVKKLENPPAAAQEEIKKIESMPAWMGFYEIILKKFQNKNNNNKVPYKSPQLFEKIREGQVWRLFTPAILHSGILHILFNMLWLWYLGKLMEPRLRFVRFFLFIIIVAVVSNTFQYLMGGPYFLGFSGIITGMIGYIFVRQKAAPWEGYNVPNAIFYFIGIFIFAMMFLQVGSFLFQVFKPKVGFTPGIANTAHIVGALVGMALAKVPFFTWRPSE